MAKKKLSQEQEEREKIAQEILADFNSKTLEKLVVSKKPKTQSLNSVLQKLRNYNIIIDQAVSWTYRQDYLDLLRNFVLKKINGETFCSEFLTLRRESHRKADEICKNIEEKRKPMANFHYSCKSENFYSITEDLFFEIDRFDPDFEDSNWNEFVYSESKLRSVIKENYLILQKVCELEDNFL